MKKTNIEKLMGLKKKYYQRPTMKVFELKLHKQIMVNSGSGIKSYRSNYGTASTDDNTEQIWD